MPQKTVSRDTGFALFLIEVIRWGAYIALFAPIIVHSGFFFPFVVPKTVFFWIFAEIIFAAWILLALANKQFRPRWNAISLSLVVFLLITIITSFTGINTERSFWSTLERMAGTVNWIHLALFFFALTFTFRSLADWRKLLTASLVASVLVALIFLFQKIGISVIPFDTKSGATIGNSSFMAAYFLFNVFFGIWLFGKQLLSYTKVFYGFCLALLVLAILFSTAYGAIVSMFGGFFVVLIAWLFFAQKLKLGRALAVLLVSAAVFLVGIVAWGTLSQNEIVIAKLPYFFYDQGTLGARKVVWNMAWQGVKEKPILGWGPENFNVVFAKYFNPCLTLARCGNEVWYDRTHNTVLDALVHSGVVGLFSYLAIFVAMIFAALRWATKDRTKWLLSGVVLATLASYFTQNLLVFDMPSTYIMFVLTLALGSAMMSSRGEEAQDVKSPDIRLVPLVGVALVYFLFSYGVQSLQAANWGIRISRGGLTVDETTRLYEKTLSITPLGHRQIVEFFTIKITDAIKQDKEQKIPLDFIYTVEKVMSETFAKNPLDFRQAIILGDLYISSKNHISEFLDKGEETLNRAIELSPTNQQGYTLLAQTHIFKKEYEKAESLLLKALDLEPKYMRSHVALANLYEFWGRTDKAEEFYKSAEKLGYKK